MISTSSPPCSFHLFFPLLTFIYIVIALFFCHSGPIAVSSFQIIATLHSNKQNDVKIKRLQNYYFMTRKGKDEFDDDNDDEEEEEDYGPQSINVLGTPLQSCCTNVRNTGIGTGYYRNGYCSTGSDDLGRHTVCVQVSSSFLAYSKQVGNDLSTPMPQYMFPGLEDGDMWCLCAQRWVQAYNDGVAVPKLVLRSTHEKTLTYVPLEVLRVYALDGEEADEIMSGLDGQRAKLNDLFKE